MKEKSIIFIDVDGTIFTPESKITSDFLNTVENVRNKGHLLFLATGRASSFLPKGLYPSAFDGYVLSHGKQIIFHDFNLYSDYLPERTLKRLIDSFQKLKIDFVCYSQDKIYFNRFNSQLHRFLLTQGIEPGNFSLIGDDSPLSHIYRIEAWNKDSFDWDNFFEKFQNMSWAFDPESDRIDINLRDASKSSGIKKVLDYLDSNSYQTVCFGNALNDIDMFELVDFPIAVANGEDELKKKAKLIAPSVYEDGVTKILKELFT